MLVFRHIKISLADGGVFKTHKIVFFFQCRQFGTQANMFNQMQSIQSGIMSSLFFQRHRLSFACSFRWISNLQSRKNAQIYVWILHCKFILSRDTFINGTVTFQNCASSSSLLLLLKSFIYDMWHRNWSHFCCLAFYECVFLATCTFKKFAIIKRKARQQQKKTV